MRIPDLLASLHAPLLASGLADRSEEGRAFFQERLVFLARVLFLVALAAFVFRNLVYLVFADEPYLGVWSEITQWVHLAGCVVLLLGWRAGRGRPLSPAVLKIVDAVLTLLVCSMPAVGLLMAGDRPIFPDRSLLVIATVLIFRALSLPSTTGWTFVVSLLGTLPFALTSVLVIDRHHAEVRGSTVGIEIGNVIQWSLVTVTIATVASFILHNLRRRVHEARQLGQYTLEEKLGEGGMGVVYRARHALLRRPTAIKLLRPDATNEVSIARFEREVQLTSRLTHPNTIAIYDYGHTPDGVFYYAMEYLPGVDLQRLVDVCGPLAQGRALHFLRQIVSSLAEAHEAGLIHRDIKPANVIVCERGGLQDVAKVLDFGLVKDMIQTNSSVSAANLLVGTPHYMAPESVRDPRSVEARSDLYAVGAVAYFLLSGRTLFERASAIEICSDQMQTRPLEPSRRAQREISPELEALVMRCLEKDIERRPRSARVLLRELEAIAGDHPWSQDDARAWWESHGVELLRGQERPSGAETGGGQPGPDVPSDVAVTVALERRDADPERE